MTAHYLDTDAMYEALDSIEQDARDGNEDAARYLRNHPRRVFEEPLPPNGGEW